MVDNSRLHRNKNFLGKRFHNNGYVMLVCDGHRRANRDGYVFEHILVFEQTYDCCVLNWGVVHHKDHNKSNNVWYNLQGMTRSQHMSLHKFLYHRSRPIGFYLDDVYITYKSYNRYKKRKNLI